MKRNFSLGTKIFISSMLGVIIMAFVGFTSYRQLVDLTSDLNLMADQWLPGVSQVGEIKANVTQFRQSQFEVLSVEDSVKIKKQLDDLDDAAGNLLVYNKAYQAIIPDPATQEIFDKYKTNLNQYFELNNKFKEFILAKKLVEAKAILTTEAAKSFNEMQGNVQKLSDMSFNGSIKARDLGAKKSSEAVKLLCVLMPFGCLVSMFLSWFTARKASRNIGQLGSQLEVSSVDLSSAATHVAESSHQLSDSGRGQAAAIEETSSALEELKGMVEQNLDHSQKSLDLADEVRKVSGETNVSMAALATSMNEITMTNEKVSKLVTLIEDIGEKIKLIDEIVFQTKLLSFNASVEAERAGEHGRGFSVVAQEVGNLAGMSGKSAVEITSIVKMAVQEARIVREETTARLIKSSSLCADSVAKVKSVIGAADKIHASCKQILAASNEQNSALGQINSSVHELNKAIQDNAATSEVAARSGSQLEEIAIDINAQATELYRTVEGSRKSERALRAA